MAFPSAVEIQDCARRCLECERVALETLTYCLDQRKEPVERGFLRLLQDCAEISHTAASFLLRGSELFGLPCAACSEVCERCAEASDEYTGDAQLELCAETCRRTAECCQRLTIIPP
jgi:hypothetical protein